MADNPGPVVQVGFEPFASRAGAEEDGPRRHLALCCLDSGETRFVEAFSGQDDEPFNLDDFGIGIGGRGSEVTGLGPNLLHLQLHGVSLLLDATKAMVVLLMVGRCAAQRAIDRGKALQEKAAFLQAFQMIDIGGVDARELIEPHLQRTQLSDPRLVAFPT